MFLVNLSSLSLVIVTNLYQSRKMQEKVLTIEHGLFLELRM